MKRRELLGVLGLAGSGGCLRLTEGGTTTTARARTTRPTATEMRTTVDTTTESSTRTSEPEQREPGYPTGLSADGVEDYLLDAHVRELGRQSFSTNWTLINQRKGSIKQRRQYEVGDGVALGSWTFEDGGPVTMYRSSEGGFWREDLGDEYTYGETRTGYDTSRLVIRAWIGPFLSGGIWSAPELERREFPARWRVEIQDFESDAEVPGYFNGTLEALSGSMVVDERGIVRSLDGEMEASETNVGRQSFAVEYAVDDVGDVTVSEPGWSSTAMEQRPRVSMALTDDERAVRLTHESGNAIEANTNLVIYDAAARRNAISYPLAEPIQSGETVYLYTEQESGFGGKLSRGSPPGNDSAVQLDSEYRAWAQRSSTEYFGTVSL